MDTYQSKNVQAPLVPPQQMLGSELNPVEDLAQYVRVYAREKPEMAALWCFGIGFILGWKLKPW